jgi:uncharacterized protein (TIGR03089 family)
MPDSMPELLFQARLTSDPSGPLVTFYDDETGERAELSAKSLGNWVAKTHFLLLDELGTAPGDRAYLSLPVHWLAAPILLGCWFAGLEVVTDPAQASVAFCDSATVQSGAVAGVPDVFAVSLLSMARSAEPPEGSSDYAAAVRVQPDSWAAVRPQAAAQDPALDGISRAQLARQAAGTAAELGLDSGGRLMWTEPEFGATAWVAALLAPLAVGGSVVLVRSADRGKTAARAASEQVTAIR